MALADQPHVRGLRAFLAVGHVELHLLALFEVSVALTGDRGIVHEHVRTTVLQDEAEALLRAEPLHGSCRHWRFPPSSARSSVVQMHCPPAPDARAAASVRELLPVRYCDAEPSIRTVPDRWRTFHPAFTLERWFATSHPRSRCSPTPTTPSSCAAAPSRRGAPRALRCTTS